MNTRQPSRPRRWLTGLGRYLLRLVGTVVGATFLVFAAIEISIPGGFRTVVLPMGGDELSPAQRAIVDRLHLDENLVVRYVHWIADVLGGDLGRSTRADTPVADLVIPRLSISIEFMLISVIGMVVLGIPLGLLAAAWSRRKIGTALNALLGLSQSIPVFITPVVLIWIFALKLQWLPAAGWVRISNSLDGNLRALILPATALIFAEVGIVARIIRADVLQVLQADYIIAATGKGLSAPYVLLRHALRPASLGLLNVIGLNIGSLLSGSIIIELIFGIGGLGQLVLEATRNRDLYLLLALTTYIAMLYVTLNTIVDLLMHVLDPRIARPSA